MKGTLIFGCLAAVTALGLPSTLVDSVSAAPACIPDLGLSSVEPWDTFGKVFVSPGTQSGIDEVTITVLCSASIPSVGSVVEVQFIGCDDLCFYDPADHIITGVTDNAGQFVFDPRIGGCDMCVVRVSIDGAVLAEYTEVASPDWDGTQADGVVDAADEAWITTEIGAGSSEPCADYNGDGSATLYESIIFSAANGVDFQPGCAQCYPYQQTYTLDPEFEEGDVDGLVTNNDALELPSGQGGLGNNFAWVANSGEGTVSKINTVTGDEVARYYSGPPLYGAFSNQTPSRVVIDDEGNCWVANRAFSGIASVTQILDSGGVDRNGSGTIETCVDFNADGVIQDVEMPNWGDDERVVRHYLVGTGSGDGVARALVLDRAGFLWVGLYTGQRVVKLRTDLSTVTYAPDATPATPPEEASVYIGHHVYGLALSCTGLLYGTSPEGVAFEVDPGLASGGTASGPALTQTISTGKYLYGIACDADGIVWLSSRSSGGALVRWDPGASWGLSDPLPSYPGRGVTVDFSGNVWRANDTVNKISVFYPNGALKATYPSGVSEPVGVGVAQDGNIIVVGARSWTWTKINSANGSMMPLPGPQKTGAAPYSYTDFTGNLRAVAALKQGVWKTITDGGHSGLIWDTISWNAATPTGTGVKIEARASSSPAQLSFQNWTPVIVNGTQPSPLTGRYLETKTTLSADVECSTPAPTPTLFDLTVGAVCDTCYFVGCAADTVVMCQGQEGAVVNYSPPVLEAGCDTSYAITCTPPSGSLFPMGSTTVTCKAADQFGNNVVCEFVVLVTGNCAYDYAGACCLDGTCMQVSPLYCNLLGGVYYSSVADCDAHCNYTGWAPSKGIVCWWPLDHEDFYGNTPNLGDPYSQGKLNGGVTAAPGEHVGNSYGFDGSTGYVDVVHRTSLDLGTSNFSVCTWVKTLASGYQPLMDKRADGTPPTGFQFYLEGGYPALELGAGGSSLTAELSAGDGGGAAFVADGAWHLIAVSVDRDATDGVRFYVDGSPVGGAFDPTGVQGDMSAPVHLLIGRSHSLGAPSAYYSGGLDEVMLFCRTLDPGEVNGLWLEDDAGMRRDAVYGESFASLDATVVDGMVTICNYDDVSHLFSYGLSPDPDGTDCTGVAVGLMTPTTGSVTVSPGECAQVQVGFESPSSLAPGEAACYRVTLYNHDTGHLSEYGGSVRRVGTWHASFEETGGGKVTPIRALNFGQGSTDFNLSIAHPDNVGGTVSLDYQLVAVSADGDTSQVLSIDGLPPGTSAADTVEVPGDGSPLLIPLTLEYMKRQQISYDKVLLLVDENNSGTRSAIAELAVRNQPVPQVGLGVPDSDDPGPDDAPSVDFRALPNPFSSSGLIEFEVWNGPHPVRICAYDLAGRLVKEIFSMAEVPPGVRQVTWDGTDGHGAKVPSGVYYLRLELGKVVKTAKVVLVR